MNRYRQRRAAAAQLGSNGSFVDDVVALTNAPEGTTIDTSNGYPIVNTPNSAASVPEHSIDNQSFYNNDWLDQQAQRMMNFQTSANKAAMDFESAEADKARAWNLEMANTAMQRRVEDLKKAGLNPALAYQLGGADVPSVNGASGFSSAGAMVSTMDQGYTKYQLDYAYTKMLVNAATDLVKVLASFVK